MATPTQIKVLQAAFRGDATNADVGSRRVRTRTINHLTGEKLLYSPNIDGRIELTPAGLSTYIDLCAAEQVAI